MYTRFSYSVKDDQEVYITTDNPLPDIHLLKDKLLIDLTQADLNALKVIEDVRPKSLRAYDQIPMRSKDLLCQVKLMASYLAGKTVAFMGDHDSTSLLLGLLSRQKYFPGPAHMLLLDFDERLLDAARDLADCYGFSDILTVQLYNVFDPVPSNLAGQFDWFYTNPPYGCYNEGESARLFITRGCELVKPENANGCIILPDDIRRSWTQYAMLATQRFLCEYNWTVSEKLNQLHRYHLDDDQELASSVVLVRHNSNRKSKSQRMPYAGRGVDFNEIPYFYGRSVSLPYPHFIRGDGSYEYN